MSLASAHITDYSHAKYIPIIDGQVLVWEEYAYVKHSANLSEYERVIEETVKLIDVFPQSHMKKLLVVDTVHLQDLLEALGTHHRVARSIDFLGSILKVVAGTPDAGDLERTRFTEMQLINSNNRQIEINTRVQVQINKLTSTVNQILKVTQNSQIDTGHLYETLLARNRMLSMELQNLMLAVSLAKANIVSPNILDHADLKSIWLEEPTNTPIGDLMSVSSVKVLQSPNSLHFIIKFPKIKFSCRKITIYPVAHKNFILRMPDNVIADCDGGTHNLQSCTVSPGATLCRLATETSCAREIHAGGTAHCEIQPSDLEAITEVDEGVIIVNDNPAMIQVDNGTEIRVMGTHLITFNDRARINGTLFVNHNNAQSRVPGIANFPILNITASQDILSLPFLHRLSERNLEEIEKFKEETGSHRIYSVAFSVAAVCCALICVGLTCRRIITARRSAKRMRDVVAEIGSAEGGLNLEGGSS